MSWRTDLIARLLGNTDLAAALGQNIAWFENARGWKNYPQLLLQQISPGRLQSHGGAVGLSNPRVQFDIYAEQPAQIDAIEAALLAEMEQAEVEHGATRFFYGELVLSRTEAPTDLGDQTRAFRLQLDFEFFWESI